MINKNLAKFCENYHINTTLKRSWYEYIFRFLYNLRLEEYHNNLYYLQQQYELLETLVEEAKKEYESCIKKIAPFTDERMDISIPDIDFSGSILTAIEQIFNALIYFSKGSMQEYNVFNQMHAQTEEVLKSARLNILRKAVDNLPNNKNVVVIETVLNPSHEETKYNFSKAVEEMAKYPKKDIPHISNVGWIAFCPRMQDNLESILNSWKGDPASVRISYF